MLKIKIKNIQNKNNFCLKNSKKQLKKPPKMTVSSGLDTQKAKLLHTHNKQLDYLYKN